MTNKELKLNPKNRYKGIHWMEKPKRWQVSIKIKGIKHYIGTFFKLADATQAYDKKAIELLGIDAVLNKTLIKSGELNPIEINEFNTVEIPENDFEPLDEEIWKDVINYEGLYMVSNLGRVRSLNRKIPTKRKTHPFLVVRGIVLSPKVDVDGYLSIILCKNTNHKHARVHRIVAGTFIPNPNNCLEVHHKNTKTSDNRVENLEWVTNHLNQYYKWEKNIKENSKTQKKTKASLAYCISKATKLNVDKVKEIKKLYLTKQYTQEEIGKMFDVSTSHIGDIVCGKRWQLVSI